LAMLERVETLAAEGVPIERWPARWRPLPINRGGRPRKAVEAVVADAAAAP